jgi:putative MATE family efflux protein
METPSVVRPAPGIWQLAWPAITANLLASLVGVVDLKIVGALGAPAVAAVTTGNRIFFILQALLMAVSAGTTALVARAWGAGDREEAASVAKASLWLSAGISLAMTAIAMLFPQQLAGIFRVEAEAVALAATFIRWQAPFQVAVGVYFALGAALRAAGDTRTPLWIGAIGNVVNVVLAYTLVYGKLGLPTLGVAGAALAGGIAFAVGAGILALLWLRGQLLIGRGGRLAEVFAGGRLRRIVDIGYPAGIEQVVWQGGFVAFLWIVSLYGTEAYAAYGIGVSLLSFSFLIGFGFSIAASTLVGQRLGARDPDGATSGGWRAMRLSLAAMFGFGLAIVLAARPLARFMLDDPEVVELTVFFIYVLGSVQPLMAIEAALGGALRGAGDTRFPLFTVFCGLIGVRLPLAALFAWQGLPVEWIYAALIADYVVKAAMLSARFRSGRWQLAIARRTAAAEARVESV